MAIIPKFFFDAVVAIGINGSNSWIGTGFLVGRKEKDSNQYTIYYVTNHHLLENKKKLILRFNKKDTPEFVDYEIILTEANKLKYSKHPNADVIAIQISPGVLKSNNSEFNWFSLDKHALNISNMKRSDVIEGSIVYSLGFPINMVGENKKTPICRLGCISRISNLFDNTSENEYLIDLQALPGFSGAPVINRPENVSIEGTPCNDSANLIGIINGTIDYSEKNDENSTEEHEKNSGFAIVHTVDTIEQVVEQEYIRNGGIL